MGRPSYPSSGTCDLAWSLLHPRCLPVKANARFSPARYNLLFFASGGGKFNYQGTKRWLEDNLDHTGERPWVGVGVPQRWLGSTEGGGVGMPQGWCCGEAWREGRGPLPSPHLPRQLSVPCRLQPASGQRGLRAVPGHRGPRQQPAPARVQAAPGGHPAARLPAGAGDGGCPFDGWAPGSAGHTHRGWVGASCPGVSLLSALGALRGTLRRGYAGTSCPGVSPCPSLPSAHRPSGF